MADHLSRLTIAHDSHSPPINDEFPEESLLLVENAPWYAHIANYLAIGEIPVDWKAQDNKYFVAPLSGPTRLVDLNRFWDARLILFIYFFFQKCRDSNPRSDRNGGSEPKLGLL